ncbi:RNA ligase [Rhodococcus sp. B10]|uniref:RNA ligase n=1 Tax=Rhodococcus sp. B10 TaxID=2695876 RepID=UPI00142F7179|nr:RNA ligase [Rhodococcus sp. B10]NIL77630.1 hypothetical protein [Rhodococcus sp. B10]
MVNIDQLMSPVALQARIDEGMVKVRAHPTLPYRIYNYSELAAYSRTWDDVTLQCRGLIVDDTGEVIARPFPKFFNDAEHDGDRLPQLDLSAPVEVTDKLDGSLGILYPTGQGGYAIATRGSFESDQAKWATQHFTDLYFDVWSPEPGFTYLFEIIYRANRIVVDYDFEGLVLLAVVDNETGHVGSPHAGYEWPGRKAERFPYATLGEALRAPVRDNAEGFVVHFQDGTMVKLKLERYVQLHKIVTGMSEKTVWEHAAAGKPFEDLVLDLPDEFHDWLTKTWLTLQKQHRAIADTARAAFDSIREIAPSGDRREFAEIAKRHDNTPLLFCLLDGQQDRMNTAIWKTLKPRGDTFMLDHSEAVA